MKPILLLLLTSSLVLSQDFNSDGKFDGSQPSLKYNRDLNGDGIPDVNLPAYNSLNPNQNSGSFSANAMTFSLLWSSPAGAFSNCWDGAVGYFDGDTLLDVAGYTFNPNMFYIWEQLPNNPDSFAVVAQFTKAEGGSYGPIVFGDTDGDGKIEIICADVSTLTRIYVYENDGNNVYVDKGTQSSLVHTNNGETAQGLFIGDMNKNGKKEIICTRGDVSGGQARVWEQTGPVGSNTYTSIYTYTTVSYLFGKGGFGDSNNNGWDEVLLTFGGLPVFNTFIRRIEYDSVTSTFQHYIFEAPSIGFPTSYKVFDINNDGTKELISTNNSNNVAASYIYRSTGQNQYVKIDSIFENADNNSMMSSDIRVLAGGTFPHIVYGSFNGRTYVYSYNGSAFTKEFENLNYPGPAIRRVYWVPWTGYDGYFNTWSSSSSNGTFYIFKNDTPVGIEPAQNVPGEFILFQNYPNPFNPSTLISYEIRGTSYVTINVYDISGKFIRSIVNKQQTPGKYSVNFSSAGLSSGIYFYTLSAGSFSDTKMMVLIK